MRQTLIYVSLDHPWSWLPFGEPGRPILHVGLGLLALLLIVGSGLWTWLKPRLQPGKATVPQWQAWFMTVIQVGIIGVLATWFSPLRVFPIYGYGMMLLLAFVCGAAWAGRRAERVGISRETIWDVAMLILVTGVVGARGFYLIQYGHRVFKEAGGPGDVLFAAINLSEGGLVLYGGIILGAIAYFLFCRWRKIHPLLLADVITPSIFLGLAFGRIGCLLNGCCFGDSCQLPWAITFPPGSVPYLTLVHLGFLLPDAPTSLPLHPTQIYSAIGGLFMAAATAGVFRYRRRNGEVLAVAAIFYPINRFLIEFLRGDEFTQFDTGLTISQIVSLGVLVCGILFTVWLEFTRRPPIGLSSSGD